MYQKNIDNGYIVSVAKGVTGGNITEDEYNDLMGIINNKPTAPDGYNYLLKEDLTWELYELPPAEIGTHYTVAELEAMTVTELKEICAEKNLPTAMTKAVLIQQILSDLVH